MDQIEYRFRLNYSKHSFIRFTSILDIQKIWERSFRRAGIKLSYSKGFHPQAKIQQASPLPLGFCGDDEVLDIWVEEIQGNTIETDQINSFLPSGLEIYQITPIDLSMPSLQQFIESSDYSISIIDPATLIPLSSLIDDVNMAEQILFMKHNGKKYDLKPLIQSICFNVEEGSSLLVSFSGASGRPDHLLQYFNLDPSQFIITRKKIHFTDHG